MTHTNTKLKHAVAFAMGLLALSAQQQALAIGLGDIQVQSHLGQPLRAKIKVFGANDLNVKNIESCFRLVEPNGGEASSSKAKLTVGALSGETTTLTLTTAQAINEPILNVSVAAECGGSVHRDYVVLLDPLMTAEPEAADEAASADEADVDAEKSSEVAVKSTTAAKTQAQTVSQAKPKSTKKSGKNKANNSENIVLHVPGGSATASGSDKAPTQALEKIFTEKTSTPRLSISGGSSAQGAQVIGDLRLDKQLHFTPDANAVAPVAGTDIEDEVTAMNKRLAHLSAQVANLQSRNLALEADNKQKTEQITQTASLASVFGWLNNGLKGALVLGVGLACANVWRRRQAKLAEAQWQNFVEEADKPLAAVNTEEDYNFFGAPAAENTGKDAEISTPDAETLDVDTIQDHFVFDEDETDLAVLDHADVFLSHGRTSMAVQLLQNHLLDHPKQSVTIWLFLLDLLAKENMQAAYEQTALECKEHFNIRIADFTNDEASLKQHLEDFPRLLSGLEQVWGSPAAATYLDDLIYNSRLETRVGFEKVVLEELLLLKEIAKQEQNTAEVIQLDEKKLALKEQKEAMLEAKKAEKLNQMALEEAKKVAEAAALKKAEEAETFETKFDFKLAEY